MFNKLNPSWSIMASAIFTQWHSFKNLTINQVAGLVNVPPPILIEPSGNIQVTIPEHYRNTWNFVVGANYYPTDSIILRGGVGYDQTPIRNAFRNVQLPDNDRYVLALGSHFQATKTIGLDVGWMHVFIRTAKINPPPQVNGAETISTTGRVFGGADLFSGQVTWDIV
jgi:long-chain fatty acid transport protein